MDAQIVANKLKLLGLTVMGVTEPDFEADGMVEFSDRVHVQVPMDGNLLGVVREDEEGAFVFGNLTADVSVIASEVTEALKLAHAAEPAARPGMRLG